MNKNLSGNFFTQKGVGYMECADKGIEWGRYNNIKMTFGQVGRFRTLWFKSGQMGLAQVDILVGISCSI